MAGYPAGAIPWECFDGRGHRGAWWRPAAGGAAGAVTGGSAARGALLGGAAGAATGALTDENDLDLGDPVWDDD